MGPARLTLLRPACRSRTARLRSAAFIAGFGLVFGAAWGVGAQTLATIVPASVGPERIAPEHVLPAKPGSADAALQPADPLKHAAMQVLETHCARCHQADKLEGRRTKPAKGFGNILDLDALAANPKYVKPGDADRSLIYHVIVRQEMPSDVFQDGDLDHPVPEDKDLAALRGWIASLDDKKAHPIEVASLPHAGEQLPAVAETRAPPPADPVRAAVDSAFRPDAKDDTRNPVAPEVAVTPGVAPVPAGPVGTQPPEPGKDQRGRDLMALAEPGHPETEATRLLISRTQSDLKRLGCYGGEPTGVVDAATDAAIARYNSILGRGGQTSPITSDLLEELQSETGSLCVARPVEASAPDTASDDEADPHPSKREKREAKPPVVHRPPVRVAHEPAARPAERKASPPPRKVAHEPQMRQPSYRQAERRPASRQAQARPSYAGQGGTGGSTAQSTVSGVSGI